MSFASERDRARQAAQQLLAQKPLFVDTETTGIGPGDEVIEICVLSAEAEVLVETLVKPLAEVNPGAARHHGITDAMLESAPSWPEVWPLVEAALGDGRVAAYNAEFDVRLMRQSHSNHDMEWSIDEGRFDCIMHLYAQFHGDWDRRRGSFRWQKLESAARQSGILLRNTHRARDDALLTQAVLRHMAGFPA